MPPLSLPFSCRPETSLAVRAAITAGRKVLELYRKGSHRIQIRDAEPVTEADIASNRILTEILSSASYPIISEEAAELGARNISQTAWIVDPLDGTHDFINKTGEFTIMISLVREHVPMMGAIYCPVQGSLCIAEQGKGTFQLSGGTWQRLSVSAVAELTLSRARGSKHHLAENERQFLQQLQPQEFLQRGSSLKVMDICAGKAELYFTMTNRIKQWDTAASHCLIHEAGGKMTDMNGEELLYNTTEIRHLQGILATNGKIHEQVVQSYRYFMNGFS